MYRRSLRKRVAIAFALCVALLSVAWGFAFFAAIKLSEDHVLQRQLEHAAQSYPNLTTNLRGYDSASDLPASLQQWAQTNPEYGIYEFDSEELHVAVVSADEGQSRAFVVFDVAQIEAASADDWWWLLVISVVVGTLGVLGFFLGVSVMRRAIAPVAELAKVVADIDLEHLSDKDHQRIESKRFGDDEVGILADTIEKTLERIGAFVARERYFTDSASHELRTPITVIMGALELLEQSDLSAADERVLERVRRATLDMKALIEMFLCLARETDDGFDEEQFFVKPIVSKAIEQHRHLLAGKLIDIHVNDLANPSIYGHPQAFSITVNNLVRNAFEHTLNGQGPINITIAESELFITNQIDPASNQKHSADDRLSNQGYGLGLGIVQRLCERNGWLFLLSADEGHVATRISW